VCVLQPSVDIYLFTDLTLLVAKRLYLSTSTFMSALVTVCTDNDDDTDAHVAMVM